MLDFLFLGQKFKTEHRAIPKKPEAITSSEHNATKMENIGTERIRWDGGKEGDEKLLLDHNSF